MNEIPVLLWKMTRRQFREGVDEGRIVGAIVPTGSTEQHNEHLEMGHDTESVVHIARLAAEKLHPRVIVTTPLAIGISEHWMDHKGTLTTRPEVFVELLHDVCDSIRRAGLRNILIVNGHAGNTHPIRSHLEDLRKRLGLNLEFCPYWEAYTREDVAKYLDSGECPGHASEFETSFALAAFPSHVHWEGVDYERARLTISSPGQAEKDRQYHQKARLATREKGQAMIELGVKWVAERMRSMIE